MLPRTLASALVLLAALPAVARAAEGDLPPPQIIRRSGGARSAPAPVPPGTAAPTAGQRPPASRSAQPVAPRAPRGGPAQDRSPTAHDTPAWRPAGAPSQREIERGVGEYLRDARALVEPASVGGSTGYDRGFLIRGGGFSLRVNVVLQARFEMFEWNQTAPAPGGDRSGFSLPRAVLRLSGEAPCSLRYLVELDVGHHGGPLAWDALPGCVGCAGPNLGPDAQTRDYDRLREAWIEHGFYPGLHARLGLLRTPVTRQLMVRPEQQQFVDISLASAWVGLGMPGYTDRNRDFGLLLHGHLGARDALRWRVSLTNGDGGDGVRNVLDRRASDNLAFAARLDWVVLQPVGPQEGALGQHTTRWYGELGAWAFYYADRLDGPHTTQGDYLRVGVDLALGYGPWSFTGAWTWTEDRDVDGTDDDSSTAWLVQLGRHVVGGAWELAARWSGYDTDGDRTGDGTVQEFAAGLSYHLNGHGNKLQLDVAWIDTDDGGSLILDPYPAYPAFLGDGDTGWLLRFQWQLAL